MRWSIYIIAIIGWSAVMLLAAGEEKTNTPLPFTQSIERPNKTWDYDGKQILGHVGEKICLWDATTGKLIRKLQGHKERLFTLRLSPDGIHALSSSWMAPGPMVAYTSKDTRTIVWNLAYGMGLAKFYGDAKRLLLFVGGE